MLDESQDPWAVCPLPLYTLHPEGGVQALNPALAALLGWRGVARELPAPARLPQDGRAGGSGVASRRLWRVPGTAGRALSVAERLAPDGRIWGVVLGADANSPQQAAPAAGEAAARDAELVELSHELRSPLNAILGFADVLMHASVPPLGKDQLAAASHIAAAGERLLLQLDGVLDLARLRLGQVRMQPTLQRPTAIWRELEQAMACELHSKGVMLETLVTNQAQEFVMLLDASRLTQLMTHMVVWMLRATRAGQRLLVVCGHAPDGAWQWSLQGQHPHGFVLESGSASTAIWALCSLLAEQLGAKLHAQAAGQGELRFCIGFQHRAAALQPPI